MLSLKQYKASALIVLAAALCVAQTANEYESPAVVGIAGKLNCNCGCHLNMACVMPPSGAVSESAATVRVPGSWVPMVVILGLFTARYAYNVMLAMHPDVLQSASFMALFSALFGFLGGLLLSRSVLMHVRTPRLMAA